MTRYAIWAAVSTPGQKENASLDEQEKKGRETGSGKGWKETAGPFIVPGKSRTQWVNLRDAENNIPQLRGMLDAAKAGRFDVLIIYDYNRLRDLVDQIAKALASYGVQIFSINQPVEPLSPEEFNPYNTDTESMMRGMSGIISRWQISDLKRKYRYGVPKRVRDGLYSIRIPYGYRKPPGRETDRKAVPIPDPAKAAAILEMKELFLAGKPYREIVATLARKGYKSPEGGHLEKTMIRYILKNPFYAGKVHFGRTRIQRDPRNDSTKVVYVDNPMMMDGKHKPLYSWDEYLRIQLEFEHRGRFAYTTLYPFSGLLFCSVCGGKIWHKGNNWYCKKNRCTHISNSKIMELIPPIVESEIVQNNTLPTSTHQPLDHSAQLAELERQRKKIQRLAMEEILSEDEALAEIKKIKLQVDAIQDEELQKQKKEIAKADFYSTLTSLKDVPICEWIRSDDPETINPILMRMIERITISPEHEIKIILRG